MQILPVRIHLHALNKIVLWVECVSSGKPPQVLSKYMLMFEVEVFSLSLPSLQCIADEVQTRGAVFAGII